MKESKSGSESKSESKVEDKSEYKISDKQLDNVLEIISLSKTIGYRNSNNVHIRCNRGDEIKLFYMYFMKNIRVTLDGNSLSYRSILCISKKKPNYLYIYLILKSSKYFISTKIDISELLEYLNDKNNFSDNINNLNELLMEQIYIQIETELGISSIKKLKFNKIKNSTK